MLIILFGGGRSSDIRGFTEVCNNVGIGELGDGGRRGGGDGEGVRGKGGYGRAVPWVCRGRHNGVE